LSFGKFKKWVEAFLQARLTCSNANVKKILNDNDLLYFYWSRNSAYSIPFMDKAGKTVISRFHGFDLYEFRPPYYIPLREEILKKLDYAVFISEHGKHYLSKHYRHISFNKEVFKLGVNSYGMTKLSTSKNFRIVSCSKIKPLKRVELIAKSLSQIDNFQIEWVHFGDGNDQEIQKIISTFPPNIKGVLKGYVTNKDVINYYINNSIDLFVNVSTSEGLPVSIMEALAAGIPIFATNVGGTSELVDNEVGRLLSKTISAEQLSEYIIEYFNLTYEERLEMAKAAHLKWQTEVCAEKNYDKFVEFLISA
jgi:glycosyltransferase involved in cell wall biosynthesis